MHVYVFSCTSSYTTSVQLVGGMTTPLRNILTWRGAISGLRDAISAQIPTVDDNSMNLMNQVQKTQSINLSDYHTDYMIESYVFNAAICLIALTTMMRENDKIRPWKQFSRTEVIVKRVVVFLLFFLAKNVDSAF